MICLQADWSVSDVCFTLCSSRSIWTSSTIETAGTSHILGRETNISVGPSVFSGLFSRYSFWSSRNNVKRHNGHISIDLWGTEDQQTPRADGRAHLSDHVYTKQSAWYLHRIKNTSLSTNCGDISHRLSTTSREIHLRHITLSHTNEPMQREK